MYKFSLLPTRRDTHETDVVLLRLRASLTKDDILRRQSPSLQRAFCFFCCLIYLCWSFIRWIETSHLICYISVRLYSKKISFFFLSLSAVEEEEGLHHSLSSTHPPSLPRKKKKTFIAAGSSLALLPPRGEKSACQFLFGFAQLSGLKETTPVDRVARERPTRNGSSSFRRRASNQREREREKVGIGGRKRPLTITTASNNKKIKKKKEKKIGEGAGVVKIKS